MDDQTEIIVRGKVDRLYFCSATFCAGKLTYSSGEWPGGYPGKLIGFAGSVIVSEGQTVALRGEIETHDKYGKQLRVSGMIYELPVDTNGLANWLAQHPDAVGIGQIRARRIVETFGEKFADVLRKEPERIASLANVSLDSIEKLRRSWIAEEEFNTVATKLVAWGLTDWQTRALLKKLGAGVVETLERDPYLLLGEIAGFGFRRVDEIAQKLGIHKDNPSRVRAGLLFAMAEFLDGGSTCPSLERLTEAANKHLALDGLDFEETIYGGVTTLLSEKAICGERLDEERFVALGTIREKERELYEWLRDGDQLNWHFHTQRASDIIDTYCQQLDGSQLEAMYMALSRRFCVISGSAGAGKTFLIGQLVRAYQAMDKTVALAAPTGKAARRLTEVVGLEGRTIHRLLEYHPQTGFRINADKPLDFDVVIIDEISMVDLLLAWHLSQAIRGRTAVVFVGDHNQLPPVGPGAILRDCLQHKIIPSVVLKHCHRHAGDLKQNCSAILDGRVADTVEHGGPGAGPWYVRSHLQEAGDVLSCLENLFTKVLPERFGYDPVADVQFLTPMHKGPLGTVALNAMFQRLHQRLDREYKDGRLLPGDKVIMTKNNYLIDVMNGHQGRVVQTDPLTVNFDGRHVDFKRDQESQVKLAYALTVHKTQGSEYPCVVAIIHRLHTFMHHRGLLYTAATRARKTCILLTDGPTLKAAARREGSDLRQTFLDLLGRRAALEKSPVEETAAVEGR